MIADQPDVSHVICLYLRHYPGSNADQFDDVFGDRAELQRGRVREIITGTIKIDLD